ncbi:aldehyde dehydrogenase family protein [Leucobacter viscericola]|uniref:Aldehyde dehydrogenase n=1 Tax=Leucobacter viscericola TaxID=2714935 RepID=A0A6G7XHU4_9MICO|nr:aldehyde dehydrogenase family protein [Leucobacter viscericola]QIK64019.1 aldehyde dehydrogenase family protein [Leucobacter viscericola]
MSATMTTRIPGIVSGLRQGFQQGVTRPETWRREQLRRLRTLLVDRGSEFERALFEDLGKSGTESQLTEIGFLVSEIDHVLAHLSKWMRPRRVGVPLAALPASAKIVPEPLGVALIIAPWNYPLMLALSPMIGALAAGNAVVVKPSELAPATSSLIARTVPDALDRRAVAVVEGGVEETTALLEVPFDHIFYTGSGRVGRVVARAAAEHLTPITLELGGKSPVYVDETVSLADAARRIAWGKYMNAGQTCVAPDYVLGKAEVLRQLRPLLADAIHELYGSASDRNPDYGRIVNDAQFERLTGYLADGEVVVGGRHDAATRFIEPTVLTGVDRESAVMRDEIFGPILPLVEVRDLDDALNFVTSRDKPLAAYVFSGDGAVRRRWERETSSGALNFDVPVLHLVAPELPFGGVGASGMGAYHGERSFTVFSHEKAVLSKPLMPETLAASIMPPYTPAKDGLVRRWLGKLL